MESVSVTKQDVLNDPKLINEWCKILAEAEKIDPRETAVKAKKEFGDNWSESKIQKLIKPEYKSKTHQEKALLAKSRTTTKKQWLRKNAKLLGHGIKKGWIEFAEEVTEPVKEGRAYVDK